LLSIPINLDTCPSRITALKFNVKNKLDFSSEVKIFKDLDSLVEFYGGEKGLVAVNESTSKGFELIVKEFLMKAAHFIFKKEKGAGPILSLVAPLQPCLEGWRWPRGSRSYPRGRCSTLEVRRLAAQEHLWDDFDRIK
jgi:hypothetical protein